MFTTKKPEVVEVTPEEHERMEEKYRMALSGIDYTIQCVRESREKVRRIFALQDQVEAGK
jgi:hypothetical protein